MIDASIPYGPTAWGGVIFVLGVFHRGWSEHTVRHHHAGGFVQERVYSIWADVLLAAGIALFAYGVVG